MDGIRRLIDKGIYIYVYVYIWAILPFSSNFDNFHTHAHNCPI